MFVFNELKLISYALRVNSSHFHYFELKLIAQWGTFDSDSALQVMVHSDLTATLVKKP
jgi:hypothetical protein